MNTIINKIKDRLELQKKQLELTKQQLVFLEGTIRFGESLIQELEQENKEEDIKDAEGYRLS